MFKSVSKLIAVSIWLHLVSFSTPNYADTATWMGDLKNRIGTKPINQVILPGTHDSGTYKLSLTIAKGQDVTSKLNLLKGLLGVGFVVNKIIRDWSTTQNRTIYEQLMDGYRYLDLRLTLDDSDGKIHIAHGLIGPLFADVVDQIKKFVDGHPDEIVVIQLGDMNYMGKNEDKTQGEIAQLLQSKFGNKIFSQKDGLQRLATPVADLQAKGKQIVFIHKNAGIVDKYPGVFWWRKTSIEDYWPNQQNVNDQKTKLDQNLDKGRDFAKFHVVQTQMTADGKTIARGLNPFAKVRKLKDMADSVKRVLTSWLDSWKGLPLNIIIVDFGDAKIAKQIYELNR